MKHVPNNKIIEMKEYALRNTILSEKTLPDNGTGLVGNNIIPIMKNFYNTFIINNFGSFFVEDRLFDFEADYYNKISLWYYNDYGLEPFLKLFAYYNYLMSNKYIQTPNYKFSPQSDKKYVNFNYESLEKGYITKNCLLFREMGISELYDKNKIQIPYFDITKKLEFENFIKHICKIDFLLLEDDFLFKYTWDSNSKIFEYTKAGIQYYTF